MAGMVLSGIIFGFCALLMIGFGISQWRSDRPTGFYTGEQPPKAEDLSDVKAWNREHGMMWVLYGVLIIASWVWGLYMGDSLLVLIPYTMGLLLPIPFMIMYHHRLIKKYRIDR